MPAIQEHISKSLDVIIPSYRFAENENYLVRIAALKYPDDWAVKFYVVGDNPSTQVPADLQKLIDTNKIYFRCNEKNMGLCYSRNRGLDLSEAAWVLFIDDDVIPSENLLFSFINAVTQHPNAIGFGGVVNFPDTTSNFTKALDIAGYTYFFSCASHKASLPWAVGANMLFNKKKIGTVRFSEEFNNGGGGDEVDFAIRIKQTASEHLVAVPEATMLHPWWNKGKPDYTRAFKYSEGNYLLLKEHPQFGIYRFPNSVELIFFSPLALVAGLSLLKWILFVFSVLLIDASIHVLRVIKNKGAQPLIVLAYSWMLKLAEQAGYLKANVKNLNFPGLFKRFDIELSPGRKRHFHTNRWIILKMILIVISFSAFCLL